MFSKSHARRFRIQGAIGFLSLALIILGLILLYGCGTQESFVPFWGGGGWGYEEGWDEYYYEDVGYWEDGYYVDYDGGGAYYDDGYWDEEYYGDWEDDWSDDSYDDWEADWEDDWDDDYYDDWFDDYADDYEGDWEDD